MGRIGELSPEINKKWMFYKVIKKYPIIISCQDQVSYPELQELVSIIMMEEDHERAYNGLQIVEQRQAMERLKSKK